MRSMSPSNDEKSVFGLGNGQQHEALYGIPYGDSTAPRESLGKGFQRALTAYLAAPHSQPERKQEGGDMALCCREVWGKGEAREYWYCNVLTGTSTQRDSHKC